MAAPKEIEEFLRPELAHQNPQPETEMPKRRRFEWSNLVPFFALFAAVGLLGQLTPGIPDELIAEIAMTGVYILVWGILPNRKK